MKTFKTANMYSQKWMFQQVQAKARLKKKERKRSKFMIMALFGRVEAKTNIEVFRSYDLVWVCFANPRLEHLVKE